MFEEESRVYKLFITYIDGYEEEYETFIKKLSSAYDFKFNNYGSLKNTDNLQEQIALGEVFILLSGLYIKYKSVIKGQLDIARSLNKPIIVIRPYGMEDVPPELEDIAVDVIGWNAPCIIDSIKEYYPDGN